MVGEESTSVRNRRSAYDSAEEKDDFSRRLEGSWSFPKSSNGQVDFEHMIMKKMQLVAEAEHYEMTIVCKYILLLMTILWITKELLIKQLKPVFMKGMENHLTEFVNNLIAKSLTLESSRSGFPVASTEKDSSSKFRQSRAPPEHGKIFITRRSLLDELFEVDHIRTIYHIFIALLILFILSTLVVDYLDQGRLVLEFDLLVYTFGKLTVVIPTWFYMFLSTLILPYGLFLQWAHGHHASSRKKVRSSFFVALFLIFQFVILGFVPTYIAYAYEVPPASRFIIIAEQIRMMMKAHSFVRENVPRIIFSTSQKSIQVPQISQYLYFLFVPTLIYRDSYPRTPVIRWNYAATKFAQVLGSLFYTYYIFVRILIPIYRHYAREPFNLRGLVLCVFNSILPGGLILFLFFFSFLHCWMNGFAEILRFGDRMFYKDWWNSTSFANYYRTWNVVVHDFLYYYAYRDFLLLFGKKFKAAAMMLVFSVSAAVHEYLLTVGFGYFYPVLFSLFIFFGMIFNFIIHDRRRGCIWNVIMWASLFLGKGLIFSLYTQEWYAQQYCPLENPTFLDYVTPRSWSCHVKI